ncbi:hypothetical protein EIN_359930 [Entamoeba invadens IP1]|uniref:Uncharacterized protein n=1 Tax=Entamoeba invadens IP1 TaxID=370355 RepID=A0A0A1U7X9_ENTIV|nr:hypothetical protein EIN_359930 [Entamoeba invadens IP1]ELP90900.1 hypothetical protein EIN_359930 [Entamoeba invadens IP1]|eukprot:XP_004257671.1 hypothetical protein EIN_359930 [Entamoeba invadens IP1]
MAVYYGVSKEVKKSYLFTSNGVVICMFIISIIFLVVTFTLKCKDFTLEGDDIAKFEKRHKCCYDYYDEGNCACVIPEEEKTEYHTQCDSCQSGSDSDSAYLIFPFLCSFIAIILSFLAVPISAVSSFALFKTSNVVSPNELNNEVPNYSVPLV